MSNDLLKCLECRLIGAPPVFNLAPPPKLPIDFLLVELPINEDLFYLTNKRKAASMSKRQKCLNLKNYLSTQIRSVEAAEHSKSSSLSSSASTIDESQHIYLNQTQSLLLFTICFLIFLIVLFVAFIFLYKLFKIKKQLNTCKSANKLSSSLTSASSTSTAPTSLMYTLDKNCPMLSAYDTSYHQKIKSLINLNQLSGSSSSSTSSSTISALPNSSLFYNQLFESTRHILQQSQSNGNENYLQAVPNGSNLIESHINHQLKHMKTTVNQHQNQISEYDEINSNSQLYNAYNQYDLSSRASNQSDSTRSTNTTGTAVSASMHTIIQPIMPMHMMPNRNSAILTHNNGLIFVNSNLNDASTVNNNNNSNNFYYAC